MASTGTIAHRLVDGIHRVYEATGAALVSFAGPQFTVTRTLPRGVLQGFLRAGPCDYIGATGYKLGNKPIRFDLKSTTSKTALDLRVDSGKLKRHQLLELLWCYHNAPGALAGILARHDRRKERAADLWYWLPVWWLIQQDEFRADGAYIKWEDIPPAFLLGEFAGKSPDYLKHAMEVASG